MVDVAPFFSFCIYMVQKTVSVLFNNMTVAYNGRTFGIGDFFLAAAILSVAIGALVSSLRGASLGREASMANRKDSIRARSLGKGGADADSNSTV